MTTEATPGPWEVFEHLDHSGLAIGPPYKEKWLKGHVDTVATISGRTSGHGHEVTDVDRANANLIAAAPALVSALEAVMWSKDSSGQVFCVSCGHYRHWNRPHSDICQSETALAQVRGEAE